MKVEVLISCMRQKDHSIIERSNIQSDVIVINQCDENKVEQFAFLNKKGENCNAKFISTTERGLSRSRNMALRNATGDICLICDDDEILDDNYVSTITQAFSDNMEVDIIAFQIRNAGKIYPKNKKRIGFISALRLASWQIAFRRSKIIESDIWFDETVGSGVSKAGGEENIFIYECLRKHLKTIFIPLDIGHMIEGESQWFNGFTKDYFYDRGIMTRKLMGRFWASLYGVYFLLRKYPLYHNDVNFRVAAANLFKTIFYNESLFSR